MSKRAIIVSLIAVLLIISGAVLFVFTRKDGAIAVNNSDYYQEAPTSTVAASIEQEEKADGCARENSGCLRRRIDGVMVKPGMDNIVPRAVVIENHPDARPLSGLAKANIVYEMEAEGGITRFLALYANTEKIPKIGPIRSARPYFIDIANEYKPVFVHCGGSPEALADIPNSLVHDLNQFYKGSYFWREQSRSAPHNVYSSSAKLDSYVSARKLSAREYASWDFTDLDTAQKFYETAEKAASIDILYKNSHFAVNWIYDIIKNNYTRRQSGQVQADESGDIITADNVIIQIARQQVIDEKSRIKIALTGSGKAYICALGKCRQGKWIKAKRTGRTSFLDEAGKAIVLMPGKTWVEIIKTISQLKYE